MSRTMNFMAQRNITLVFVVEMVVAEARKMFDVGEKALPKKA